MSKPTPIPQSGNYKASIQISPFLEKKGKKPFQHKEVGKGGREIRYKKCLRSQLVGGVIDITEGSV